MASLLQSSGCGATHPKPDIEEIDQTAERGRFSDRFNIIGERVDWLLALDTDNSNGGGNLIIKL